MKLETLKELYIDELKDLYSAEKQILRVLPKMARAAANPRLANCFRDHLVQTREHAVRLEKILASHKQGTRGPKCKGMEGILEEAAEIIRGKIAEDMRDVGLIAAARHVEHYEIAGYGMARTCAEILGDTNGAKLLQKTLREESDTDRKLGRFAVSSVNLDADT